MAIADAPVRRIVTVDGDDGRSYARSDAAVDDVLRDPARPGYGSSRVWATDRTPATPLTAEQVARLPQAIAPPPGGSLFRIVTVPPDRLWRAHAAADAARVFFAAAGSPAAWCGEGTADPYMQHSRTLDLCVVLEGELTLVLDTAEVALAAGDTVVQRATRHAWRNRSAHPAVIAISSHDAEDPQAP
jgi:mannose-6-phosphate isomerase-like protein (cupin superfamily)